MGSFGQALDEEVAPGDADDAMVHETARPFRPPLQAKSFEQLVPSAETVMFDDALTSGNEMMFPDTELVGYGVLYGS